MSNDIKEMKSQINDGFIDLKHFVGESFNGLIDHQQKVKLSEAFQHYLKGVSLLQRSLVIKDQEIMKQNLLNAINRFDDASVIYDSQKSISTTTAAVGIRVLEANSTVEAIKAETYKLLGEKEASIDSYSDLFKKLKTDLKEISERVTPDDIDLVIQDSYFLHQNDIKFIEKN